MKRRRPSTVALIGSGLAAASLALGACGPQRIFLSEDDDPVAFDLHPYEPGSVFDFTGTRVGSVRVERYWRTAFGSAGEQRVRMALEAAGEPWQVDCLVHSTTGADDEAAALDQLCHFSRAGEAAPRFTLAQRAEGLGPSSGWVVGELSLRLAGLPRPSNAGEALTARVFVHSTGEQETTLAVWDRLPPGPPRLWVAEAVPLEDQVALELLAAAWAGLQDPRERFDLSDVRSAPFLDDYPLSSDPPPIDPVVRATLHRHADALEQLGARLSANALRRKLRLDERHHIDITAKTPLQALEQSWRPLIELRTGPILAEGLGGGLPGPTPAGFLFDAAFGFRWGPIQLYGDLGFQWQPYSSAAVREQLTARAESPDVSSATSFVLGVGARWTAPLTGGLEAVLGVSGRFRATLNQAGLLSRLGEDDDEPDTDMTQLGFGLGPTIGVQHATTLDPLGTRAVFFLEAAPEWTWWVSHLMPDRLRRDERTADLARALDDLARRTSFQIQLRLGFRLEF